MKIDICLVTTNENPCYYIFYPWIKPIWEKLLGVKCILIYIGEVLPTILLPYEKDIILFKPIEKIHTAFIAQNIRLLYPCIMDCENGVLISDIDAVALNGDYFTDQIKNLDDDCFIHYSHSQKVYLHKEYIMSYNLASPKTWRDIFKISNIEDINSTLIDWFKQVGTYSFHPVYRSKCKGFHFDQQSLYKYLESWNKKDTKLIKFNIEDRKGFYPLNKINDPTEIAKIKRGEYHDCLVLRPYRKNSVKLAALRKILLGTSISPIKRPKTLKKLQLSEKEMIMEWCLLNQKLMLTKTVSFVPESANEMAFIKSEQVNETVSLVSESINEMAFIKPEQVNETVSFVSEGIENGADSIS